MTSIGVDRDRSEAAAAEATRYLTFTLRDDAYALDIFHVTAATGVKLEQRRPVATVTQDDRPWRDAYSSLQWEEYASRHLQSAP